MTEVDLRIESYFSLPTDLASEMAAWAEFVSGSGYNVDLRSDSGSVTIRFESSGESQFVRIYGVSGPLFDRCGYGCSRTCSTQRRARCTYQLN